MEELKFKVGEQIIHKRDKWQCVAIDGPAIAVFARIDVRKAVVKSSTYINLEKLFAVVNDPDVMDDFQYIRTEEK